MKKMIQYFIDERGATAIEYGLIAALISVAIIAVLTLAGDSLVEIFTAISDELQGAADGTGSTTTE